MHGLWVRLQQRLCQAAGRLEEQVQQHLTSSLATYRM